MGVVGRKVVVLAGEDHRERDLEMNGPGLAQFGRKWGAESSS